jgi:hypothetical protein
MKIVKYQLSPLFDSLMANTRIGRGFFYIHACRVRDSRGSKDEISITAMSNAIGISHVRLFTTKLRFKT